MASQLLSELFAVVARIAAQTVSAAATASSDVIDMANFHEVVFLVNIGDYAAGNDGSLACSVYYDTASGGSFANVVTGKTLTVATFTGSTGDNQHGVIHVRAEELVTEDADARYIRLKATPTNEDLLLGAVALGRPRYQPGKNFDLSAVHRIPLS